MALGGSDAVSPASNSEWLGRYYIRSGEGEVV